MADLPELLDIVDEVGGAPSAAHDDEKGDHESGSDVDDALETASDAAAEAEDSDDAATEQGDDAAKADDGREPDDQSDPGDENPELAEKAEATGELAKGLWHIGDLANILAQLQSLQECAEWESMAEGDNSPLPADLKAAVSTLADILVRMTSEEVAEMQAEEGPGDINAADDVAMADKPTTMKAENIGEDMLAKFQSMLDDAIAKAVTPLNDTIAKQADEIAALKAMPAPAKGVVMQVSKAEDIGQPAIEKVEPVLNPDGSVNEAATEIKKLARAGGIHAR